MGNIENNNNKVRKVESVVPLLLPDLPIAAHRIEHGLRGVVQPLPFLLIEMAKDGFTREWSAQMDVGSFKSHGVEQSEFGIRAAQGREFNARTVGAEAADNPASAQLHKRIRTAYCARDDGLIQNV